ncbi:hypothetical protein QZH41_009404, partial [Actinostola sp. cb2023]
TLSVGGKVRLIFDAFELEPESVCKYDYVLIRDGASPSSHMIGKFCGSSKPATITSSGSISNIFLYSGGCDLTLRGSGGTIKSPNNPSNYPINKKCSWTIKVDAEEQVELEFRTVDLERDSTCRYDYIEIRDGSNQHAALKERFCGNTVPPLIKSSGDALHVAFFSDASDTRTGFYATWRAVDGLGRFPTTETPPVTTKPPAPGPRGCGGRLTALTGVFQSPQYPQNYPTNKMCHWNIQVPQDYKIRLEFSNFNLEADSGCRFDYLIVYDGPSVASSELGRLCGNDGSSRINSMDSSTNEMTVVFNSDTSVTAGGFQAYWTAHTGDGRIPTTPFKPVTPRPHTPPSGECGGNFVKPSGDLYSPGYPYYYGNNVDCVWVLGVPDNKLIAIGFNEFELEGGVDCRFDYVELRDGESQNSPFLGRYCGRTAPLMIMGSSDKLWLKFHTNGFVSSKGFEATWTTEAQIIKPIGGNTISLQRDSRQPSPSKKCGHPLGLQSKAISDSQLTASSSWMSAHKYGPQQARLNNREWPQGWVADSRDQNPWLKIKLNGWHIITAIATQGYGNQIFNEWVKSYQVSWYDRKHGYVNYQERAIEKIFDANTDRDSVVRHLFKVPINAEEIVIRPKTWQGNVGLRIELYGCTFGDCIEPLGLANGAIKDNQLKASSAWNHEHSKYGANRARLNITSWPQGWTASEQDRFPWLQINLQDDYVVTQVATQGFGGALNQWVKSYKLTWMDDNRNWRDYYVPRKVGVSEWRIKRFRANSDRNSITRHVLKVPIRSKVIRFWPQERHNFVSMRTELYGCPIEKHGGETRCDRTGNRLVGESRLTSVKQCIWKLTTETTTQGKYILKFDEFSFQRNADPSCTKDYVEVRNGFTQYAPLIGKYCGNNKPRAIRSSNGALWVRFVVSGETRTKVAMSYEFVSPEHSNHHEDIQTKGKERKGKERKGKERKGKERKGKERKGKERKGKERKGKERKGKERKGKERKGKERKGKERKGKERKGKERKERKGKERKGKERKGKERKGKERKGKERKGKERKPRMCGLRSLTRGLSAQINWPGQWPWQVALSLMGQSNQQCGGALIGTRWVLTAAHCFNRFQLSSYWIAQAGMWDLRRKDGNEQESSAKAIYVHPQYDRLSHQNDIALIYLQNPVTFNERVKPICLGKRDDVKSGKMCSVAGWGSSTAPQGTSVTLLNRDLPLVSNQQCNSESHYGDRVDANMICAGYAHGGADSCYGDGGSPLMCQDASNKWVVSGISSWGEGCGLPGKYGVYTNVASYQRWIEKVMSSH